MLNAKLLRPFRATGYEIEIFNVYCLPPNSSALCGNGMNSDATKSSVPTVLMFQTENYEGGFDATEKEFVFSFYDDNEYWFQMTLQQVKEISTGQLKSVFGLQSDYYND